jgi:N-acetylmuramoyl-L-alanine amidase
VAKKIVVVDPGHGGADCGAVGGKLEEADVVLAISKHLVVSLGKYPNVAAYPTRVGDVYVGRTARANIANNWIIQQPESQVLFVSLHVNSVENLNAKGHSVFYHRGRGDQQEFAIVVHKEMAKAFPELPVYHSGVVADLDVRSKEITVLSASKCPACLVEFLFISNPGERELLKNDTVLRRAADAIAAGVVTYTG